MNIYDTHFALVQKVNAGDMTEHELHLWREGYMAARGSAATGRLIMDADLRMMELGHDEPMCGGVLIGGGAK